MVVEDMVRWVATSVVLEQEEVAVCSGVRILMLMLHQDRKRRLYGSDAGPRLTCCRGVSEAVMPEYVQ